MDGAACRAAIHASLIALYGLGGWLVSQGLMPLRVLLSAIGFTFSLVFATQGCVQTFSDAQRALVSLARWVVFPAVSCDDTWSSWHGVHSTLPKDRMVLIG